VRQRRSQAAHIQRFLAAAGLSPDESPRHGDKPDCLLQLDGTLIGIEHTEFFFPADQGQITRQKLDALQTLAINEARRLFREGEDELWHGGCGQWVATVEPAHVQACLDKKAPLYQDYRRRAPMVWLLIANDMAGGGAACEIGVEATAAAYGTPSTASFGSR
jgi:hypothetical protein